MTAVWVRRQKGRKMERPQALPPQEPPQLGRPHWGMSTLGFWEWKSLKIVCVRK